MRTSMIDRVARAWPAGALAFVLAGQAAEPVKLDVKLGLWEMTSTGKSTGEVALPDALLRKLPPERRQQLEAALEAVAGKPLTVKRCLTAGKVAEAFNLRQGERAGCQPQVLANTADDLEVTGRCERRDQASESFKAHFHRDSREAVTGTVSTVLIRGAQTMSIHRDVKGKWLGASCGELK